MIVFNNRLLLLKTNIPMEINQKSWTYYSFIVSLTDEWVLKRGTYTVEYQSVINKNKNCYLWQHRWNK